MALISLVLTVESRIQICPSSLELPLHPIPIDLFTIFMQKSKLDSTLRKTVKALSFFGEYL